MYIVHILGDRIVKRQAIILGLLIVVSVLAGFNACAKFDDVDDQSPVLIVHIKTDPTITVSDTNKVYLVFYSDSAWTSPWLQFGANSHTLINPVMGTLSTYVAAFWDADGDTVLDAGEPCTGYSAADHTVPDQMKEIEFLPLEWREITIELVPTRVY